MVVNKAEIGKKYGQQEKFWDTQQNLSELTMINKTTISEIEMDVLLELFYIFEHVLDAVGLQFEVTEKKHSQLG